MTNSDIEWITESGYLSYNTTNPRLSEREDSTTLVESELFDDDSTIINYQPVSSNIDNVGVGVVSASSVVSSTSMLTQALIGSFANCMEPVKSVYSNIKQKFNPYIIDITKLKVDEKKDYWLQGSEGRVFKCLYNGREVALKRLHTVSKKNIMFNVELIQILARLNHPNIVQVFAYSLEPPQYTMEFITGQSLCEYISGGGGIIPDDLIHLCRDIVQGMQHLHDLGIIHCDIKSGNLMLTMEARVKIIDFECSQILPRNEDTVCLKEVYGTTPYMSREMIQTLPISVKHDIWSFGVVLWEMINLQTPYKNMDEEFVFYGVGTQKLSLPIAENIPDGFKLLLQICWKKEPEARPDAATILKHLDVVAKEMQSTCTESFRQSQMSWRNEFENIPWDKTDLEKWKQELDAYKVLQLKYHALSSSYRNLLHNYKKMSKKENENCSTLFTRKKKGKCKSKSSSKSKDSLFSNDNQAITRTRSAPALSRNGSNASSRRPTDLAYTPLCYDNPLPSPVESDDSRHSAVSGRQADIESAGESSDCPDVVVIPKHLAKSLEDDIRDYLSDDEGAKMKPLMSSSLITRDSDTNSDVSLDKFGVRC